MNIPGWFPLGLTGLISFLSNDSQESSPAPQFKRINSSAVSLLYGPTLTSIHDYWKNHSFDYMDHCWQRDVSAFFFSFLFFNTLSRFVIAFLPSNKCLSISWLQSPSTVILESKKIKSATVSIFSPSTCNEEMGLDTMIFVCWMLSFRSAFALSSFNFLFSSSLFSAVRVVSSAYLSLLIFLLAILIPACESSSPAFQMMYFAFKFFWGGRKIWNYPRRAQLMIKTMKRKKISGPRQKKKVLGHLPQLDDKYISKYLFQLFLSIILNLHQWITILSRDPHIL